MKYFLVECPVQKVIESIEKFIEKKNQEIRKNLWCFYITNSFEIVFDYKNICGKEVIGQFRCYCDGKYLELEPIEITYDNKTIGGSLECLLDIESIKMAAEWNENLPLNHLEKQTFYDSLIA